MQDHNAQGPPLDVKPNPPNLTSKSLEHSDYSLTVSVGQMFESGSQMAERNDDRITQYV